MKRLALLLAFLANGCASTIAAVMFPYPFIGVVCDTAIIGSMGEIAFPGTTPGDYFLRYALMLLAAIDWFPSLAGDIVLFPWDLFGALYWNLNPIH